MHRIVHLDLKGFPLKVPYLEKVLISVKQWGATGILFEWEDTFPYTSELIDIGSQRGAGGDGLYNIEEIHHILHFTKKCGLEVIQLIQTIGHMEFVLKHPAFRGLREAAHSPAVLCPSRPESQALVRAMLTQALDVQPDAAYLHIGADEVWHTGICDACQGRALASEYGTASLYLEHVRDLALYLKQKRPGITVLMWDDMLRNTGIETLKVHQIGELVQPVVWHYNPAENFHIDPSVWTTYKFVFRAVWVGSAFKGANGSCQILSPVSRYTSNQEAWLSEMEQRRTGLAFAGVVLTGWSRYDHYATLCELLPTSLPSLAACLQTWLGTNEKADNAASLPRPWAAGTALQRALALRDNANALLHGDLVLTWLNPWQVENNYTNPVQIQGIAITAQVLSSDLTSVQEELMAHFLSVTGKRSAEEWIRTFITPILLRINELQKTAESRCYAGASVEPSMR